MDEDGIVILVLDTPISEATVTIVTYVTYNCPREERSVYTNLLYLSKMVVVVEYYHTSIENH